MKKFLSEWIVPATLAALVIVLLTVWSFPGLHPAVWTDTAIAAGLLPQKALVPNLGISLFSVLFSLLPLDAALTIMGVLAKVMVALFGVLAYQIFAGMMRLVAGAGNRDVIQRERIICVVAAIGAILFVASDPIWILAQGLSESLCGVLLILLAMAFSVRFLEKASATSALVALAALGLLAAESPLGWLALFVIVFVVKRYLGETTDEKWAEFLDPLRMQKTKWTMTFVFIIAFAIGALIEVLGFVAMDGLKAGGFTADELFVRFWGAYASRFSSSSMVGIILLIAAAVVPAVLTQLLVKRATDGDKFLPFPLSITYILCGLIAYLQLSPFSSVWFWSAVKGAAVSPLLTASGVLLAAMSVTWTLFVFAIEIFCRDYAHIEAVMNQDATLEESEPHHGSSLRWILLAVPLLLVIISLGGRRLSDDRRLQGIITAYVDEVLREAEGVKYLFTDGGYDAYMKLEARRRGLDVRTISVMGGNSRYDAYVRLMAGDGHEDAATLSTGAAETIRTWTGTRAPQMKDMAVQLAFELFRIDRRLEPLIYGALVRPVGGVSDVAEASISRCHRLAEEIVEIQKSGVWRHAKHAYLKDRFLFAQFRLAVISRLRAIRLDAKGKVKESLEEIAVSDALNANNPSLSHILKRMDWVRRQNGEDLTPREGLEVAMKRTDFTMARRYAMPILAQHPDDPTANFALGMSYYAEQQFAKAEKFLKNVLKESPNEPAVYNNLALVCLKSDRLEEAEQYVNRALELKGDQPEIRDTARQIQEALGTRILKLHVAAAFPGDGKALPEGVNKLSVELNALDKAQLKKLKALLAAGDKTVASACLKEMTELHESARRTRDLACKYLVLPQGLTRAQIEEAVKEANVFGIVVLLSSDGAEMENDLKLLGEIKGLGASYVFTGRGGSRQAVEALLPYLREIRVASPDKLRSGAGRAFLRALFSRGYNGHFVFSGDLSSALKGLVN